MRLPMPARVLLTLSALHLVQRGVAWACSCATSTPQESWETADQVFVGTARGTSWSCDRWADHRSSFEVTEAFLGVEEGEMVTVQHSLDGASCGMEFEAGESYLVVAYEGSTNLCTLTGPAGETQASIDQFRQLAAD